MQFFVKRFSKILAVLSNSRRFYCSNVKASECLNFDGKWPAEEKAKFVQDMRVFENFLSEEEETKIMEEIEPYLKRMKYEFDHWDDAIHGFRETERRHWYPDNKKILQRILDLAFKDEPLPFVHVLDLSESGHIKPHVDSVRYCGTTIAGVSLLSDSIMRLVRTDEKFYLQQDGNDDYRNTPQPDKDAFFVDCLLKRRSLYIMADTARYNFTHEILAKERSIFKGEFVPRGRRISIICRNEPKSQS